MRGNIKLVAGAYDKVASTWTRHVEIDGVRTEMAVVYREIPVDRSNRRYTIEIDGEVLFADTSEKAMKSWIREGIR